jgi:pyruvate-formate lyase-activating enzyme
VRVGDSHHDNLGELNGGALRHLEKNVVDCELLPYLRFGESKYGFLGRIYEMQDFDPPSAELLARLRAIINAAFG